jgi:hypothetical protein
MPVRCAVGRLTHLPHDKARKTRDLGGRHIDRYSARAGGRQTLSLVTRAGCRVRAWLRPKKCMFVCRSVRLSRRPFNLWNTAQCTNKRQCYREYHRKLHDLRAIFIRSITPATPLPHPDIYAATSDSWQRVRIDGIS